jgi:hypothetical protein
LTALPCLITSLILTKLQQLTVVIQVTDVGGQILVFRASRRAERNGDLHGINNLMPLRRPEAPRHLDISAGFNKRNILDPSVKRSRKPAASKIA